LQFYRRRCWIVTLLANGTQKLTPQIVQSRSYVLASNR